jgi:hypothetical protein
VMFLGIFPGPYEAALIFFTGAAILFAIFGAFMHTPPPEEDDGLPPTED